MARIAIYDPADPIVNNRVTEYHKSANTPDFDSEPNKLVNPDLTPVLGVPQKYWKFDGVDALAEMTQPEKDAVDAPVRETGTHGEAETQTSTTSTAYQQKLVLTTDPLPNGEEYQVMWYAEARNTSTSSRTQIKVDVGGTTLCEPSIEAEDSDDYVPFSGFAIVTGDGNAATITLSYRKQENSGTAYVRRARLFVKSVGTN